MDEIFGIERGHPTPPQSMTGQRTAFVSLAPSVSTYTGVPDWRWLCCSSLLAPARSSLDRDLDILLSLLLDMI